VLCGDSNICVLLDLTLAHVSEHTRETNDPQWPRVAKPASARRIMQLLAWTRPLPAR
jgi:hypothetical protein